MYKQMSQGDAINPDEYIRACTSDFSLTAQFEVTRLSRRIKSYIIYTKFAKSNGKSIRAQQRTCFDDPKRITISRIPAVAPLAQAINNSRRGRAISRHYEIIIAVVQEPAGRNKDFFKRTMTRRRRENSWPTDYIPFREARRRDFSLANISSPEGIYIDRSNSLGKDVSREGANSKIAISLEQNSYSFQGILKKLSPLSRVTTRSSACSSAE